jgi:uncharacterized protein (DUF2252 family)
VLAAVASYREAMRSFAAMRDIDVWYSRLDAAKFWQRWQASISGRDATRLQKNMAKAQHKDSLRALEKLTVDGSGEPRIASRPPLLIPVGELAGDHTAEEVSATIEKMLAGYRRTLASDSRRLIEGYRFVDAAHKVVGVGSVGNRSWIALLLGRDARDPLFLQLKEAQASVLEPFAGASRFRQHGHRVVAGQRLMQAAGDMLLGWLTVDGLDGKKRDFYVRQLWDGKGSLDVETVAIDALEPYAHICGWTLARAHARSADRIAIASYLGKSDVFDCAVADYAAAYADLAEHDYGALVRAVEDGRLPVSDG